MIFRMTSAIAGTWVDIIAALRICSNTKLKNGTDLSFCHVGHQCPSWNTTKNKIEVEDAFSTYWMPKNFDLTIENELQKSLKPQAKLCVRNSCFFSYFLRLPLIVFVKLQPFDMSQVQNGSLHSLYINYPPLWRRCYDDYYQCCKILKLS